MLLMFLYFFIYATSQRDIFERPRPIAMKLCQMIGNRRGF